MSMNRKLSEEEVQIALGLKFRCYDCKCIKDIMYLREQFVDDLPQCTKCFSWR